MASSLARRCLVWVAGGLALGVAAPVGAAAGVAVLGSAVVPVGVAVVGVAAAAAAVNRLLRLRLRAVAAAAGVAVVGAAPGVVVVGVAVAGNLWKKSWLPWEAELHEQLRRITEILRPCARSDGRFHDLNDPRFRLQQYRSIALSWW
jgi:hypothetical protein